MNFLNFLTSKAQLFNFSLLSQSAKCQRENTILVQPSKEKQPFQAEKNESQPTLQPKQKEENKEEKASQMLAGQISQLLTQQQMLINQYMELKLKYLANCLNLPQPQMTALKPDANSEVNSQKQKNSTSDQEPLRKKIKKMNKCGHDDKSHYAKGMCNNCYHKYGRTKKPWNCPHDKLYAAGMCQNCYINNYNRKRREEKQPHDRNQEQGPVEQSNPLN